LPSVASVTLVNAGVLSIAAVARASGSISQVIAGLGARAVEAHLDRPEHVAARQDGVVVHLGPRCV